MNGLIGRELKTLHLFGLLCSIHYIELRNFAIVILPPFACTSFAVKITSQEQLAKGDELLKRTRKGDLHWKIVTLKIKSRHVAGTITKKKKEYTPEDLQRHASVARPDRHLLEAGEYRQYVGLKTEE
ncbi:hypothetical protein Sjap_019225 [Stephania japonica]|uniref:Pleckstrin-like plant domain-containing protein n=1 Tax=Stephania japonica TaxID=461633 RepID=A0AAP0HZ52_9MAGN